MGKGMMLERQLILAHLPNVYFFDNPPNVFVFLTRNVILSEVNFYEPTNVNLIKQILID
jgi:hypothetical protein